MVETWARRRHFLRGRDVVETWSRRRHFLRGLDVGETWSLSTWARRGLCDVGFILRDVGAFLSQFSPNFDVGETWSRRGRDVGTIFI